MTTVETNPMISIYVKIWKNMGYVYAKDNRYLITLFPNSVLWLFQMCYLGFSGASIENLTLNSFFTTILTNSMVSSNPY